jgi:hypothetical protein
MKNPCGAGWQPAADWQSAFSPERLQQRAKNARLFPMSSFEFGLFCLLGFALPVPILAWLDRVSTGKKR